MPKNSTGGSTQIPELLRGFFILIVNLKFILFLKHKMQIQELKINPTTVIYFMDLTSLDCIGRAREKKGLQQLLKHYFNKDVELIYDNNGKPFINNENVHISVSHSHHLLALIVSHQNVAIDVELISEKVERVKTKFLNDQELIETEIADNKILTTYWCAKETLFKYLGLKGKSLKNDFIVSKFNFSTEEGRISGFIDVNKLKKEITLRYFMKDNFVVVHSV